MGCLNTPLYRYLAGVSNWKIGVSCSTRKQLYAYSGWTDTLVWGGIWRVCFETSLPIIIFVAIALHIHWVLGSYLFSKASCLSWPQTFHVDAGELSQIRSRCWCSMFPARHWMLLHVSAAQDIYSWSADWIGLSKSGISFLPLTGEKSNWREILYHQMSGYCILRNFNALFVLQF
jgi:hypothetical protein